LCKILIFFALVSLHQMATAQRLIMSSKISKADFLMVRRVVVQGILLI
jgi:hypothetical protein